MSPDYLERHGCRFWRGLPSAFSASFWRDLVGKGGVFSKDGSKKEKRETEPEEVRRIVLDEISGSYDRLRWVANRKMVKNGKIFPYHGPHHVREAVESVKGIAEANFDESAEDLMLAEIITHWHDWRIGDNPETPQHERDEVVSARALKDEFYKTFRIYDLEDGDLQRQVWDELIKKMQVALIATSVNKALAIPKKKDGSGGESEIVQFDIARNATDLFAVVDALGYAGNERLIKDIKKSPKDLLSQVVCAADLGYFAQENEDVFWEMVIRYGLERGALQRDCLASEVRAYLEGQVIYLTNYRFPEIRGVEELKERKAKNIEKIEDLLKRFKDDDEGLEIWFGDQLLRLGLN